MLHVAQSDFRDRSLRDDWFDFMSALEGIKVVRLRRPGAQSLHSFEDFFDAVFGAARSEEFAGALELAFSQSPRSASGLGAAHLVRLEVAAFNDSFANAAGLDRTDFAHPATKEYWADSKANAGTFASRGVVVLGSVRDLWEDAPLWAKGIVKVIEEAMELVAPAK